MADLGTDWGGFEKLVAKLLDTWRWRSNTASRCLDAQVYLVMSPGLAAILRNNKRVPCNVSDGVGGHGIKGAANEAPD